MNEVGTDANQERDVDTGEGLLVMIGRTARHLLDHFLSFLCHATAVQSATGFDRLRDNICRIF
jgi:hypothetical protein